MRANFDAESTLTDRFQTTVPETVRRSLGLGKRDKIHYIIRPSGEVILTKAPIAESEDPLLGTFLDFLAQDMASHPDRLQVLDASFVQKVRELVGDLEVDLKGALSADDE